MSAPVYTTPAAGSILANGSGTNPLMTKGSKVDLKLTGYQLPSLMPGQPPAAFAVVFCRNFGKSDWVEISRSETIADSAPTFQKLFSLDYEFAVYQEIRVVVFDRSTQNADLRQQRLIGVADSTLGKILSARGTAIELPLSNAELGPDSNAGKILISADAVLASRKDLILDLSIAELMSQADKAAQISYISQLEQAAGVPISNPPKLKKGALSSVMGKFKKDSSGATGALPAHLENQQVQQQQQHAAIQAQYTAAVNAPPPFSPYVVVSRAPSDAISERDYYASTIAWETVFSSPPMTGHMNVNQPMLFQNIRVSIANLCEGNDHRLLKISVHRTGGGNTGAVIGETVTTLYALRKLAGSTTSGSTETMEMKPTGKLAVVKMAEEETDTFVDYVQSGRCDFSLICAVDFTSSNGNPAVPNTGHYIAPQGGVPAPNQYEAAMRAVGNILASYSTENKIHAFGFGANLPPAYDTSFCFPVEVSDPAFGMGCNGVDELIHAYKATLSRVQLAGPTIFSEVLRTAGTITSRNLENANRTRSNVLPYSILLILTDGVISDFDAALAQLIALSALPISVIIVGIGGEDFRKMQQLDEGKRLRRGTMSAERDIVQFVPFREFKGDPAALAEAVLTRLPEQVMSYVKTIQQKQHLQPSYAR